MKSPPLQRPSDAIGGESLCDSQDVETATQTLHRLTSYTWDGTSPPATSPTSCGPYPSTTLGCSATSRSTTWIACRASTSGTRRTFPARRSPATCRPRRHRPSACSRAPARSPPRRSISRTSRGCCTCPRASCAPWRLTVTRRERTSESARPGCSAPRAPRAGGSRSSSTSPCPTVVPICHPACIGMTRRITPSCGSGRLPTATLPSSSSPVSRGGPAGGTASAGSVTSIGMPARCSRSSSRSRTQPVTQLACTLGSRTPRWRRSSAPTACTNGRSRSWSSGTASRRSRRRAMPWPARST